MTVGVGACESMGLLFLMDSRKDHAHLLMRQQRLMNGVRRDMAAEISAAITARCGERDTYDLGCHQAVMRDVDRIMDGYYGAFRGDPRASLIATITTVPRQAYELALQRSREVITRHLLRFAPDLLAALKERARQDDGR